MKYFELDKNEQKLATAFEWGKLKSIKSAKKTARRYQQYAQATLNKARQINIRLSSRDLQKIKALAAAQGLPYQTLISSVIHQYSDQRVKVAD